MIGALTLGRARRTFLTVAVAAALFLAVAVGTSAIGATSAAWTNDARAAAAASSGTWSAAGVGCVVTDSAGNPVPGPTCQVAFGPDTDGSANWNIKATVSTTSATPVYWKLTVDFAAAPFAPTVKRVGEYSGGAVIAPLPAGFCSASTRAVTFTGRADWGRATISASSPVVLDFVGSNTGNAGNLVYACP
ncbi:hypothetical protein [Cellulomonas sp. Leaf334]|uniref:hypothetical protein n=1 Tax=Cellulomonas sp. Leaf334 TaxID=1736339 RepID=UPI0006FE2EA6|nr:hypothetical protein [Cellulomonas sp. Leaf334]KQR12032.1 hypothetical protein ASF78_12675 [Cellulomonas sp. Leaf334]